MSNLEELRSVVRQIKTLWHRHHHHPELPGLRAREKELRRALGLRWNEPIPGGERQGTTLSNYDRRCIREFGCTREEMDRQVRALTGSWAKDRD